MSAAAAAPLGGVIVALGGLLAPSLVVALLGLAVAACLMPRGSRDRPAQRVAALAEPGPAMPVRVLPYDGAAARPPGNGVPTQSGPVSAPAAAAAEQRTTPAELFWDLVFVFAVTQVTTLLYNDLSWAGFGRAMLVLGLIWWAWSGFVWATNAQDPNEPRVQSVLFLVMVLTFIVALSIPGAFSNEATLFAAAYAGVRLLHLGLYVDASRRGNASRAAIAGFAVTVALGMALLVVGSRVGDPRPHLAVDHRRGDRLRGTRLAHA